MLTSQHTSVLIVGAGPSGLTAAIELTRQDIPVRIIDKVLPRLLTESRALGTNVRSLDVFERFGVAKKMIDAARQFRGFSFYANGRQLGELIVNDDPSRPRVILLPQSQTERFLLEKLSSLGIEVERPLAIVAVQQNSDHVAATLSHPDGHNQQVTADYLLAADGGRSSVRKLLGLSFEGERMQGEFLVDCKVDWTGRQPTDGEAHLSQRNMLLVTRLTDEIWRVMISMQQDDPVMSQEPPTLELMQTLINEHAGIQARLYGMQWHSAYYISSRLVEHLREGRIFLVGDAGHIHSPVGGQGMNTGVQDAMNLSWKLALRLKGLASDSLLESYHAERHPFIKSLLKATAVAENVLLLQQPLATGLRNELVSLLSGFGFAQQAGQVAIGGGRVRYPNSPIIVEHHASFGDWLNSLLPTEQTVPFGDRVSFERAPQAGDYAPAISLIEQHGQTQTLLQVLNKDSRQVLLVFAGHAVSDRVVALQELVNQANQRYSTLLRAVLITRQPVPHDINVWIDRSGLLTDDFGAEAECLYLIRPDGYIGFRSQPAKLELLSEHLNQVYVLPVAHPM